MSQGASCAALYRIVSEALAARGAGGALVDVGCGSGQLRSYVRSRFARYIGLDAVRYEGFPPDGEFHRLDLDAARLPLPDASADAVAAVEVIEHLENPRAFMRELVRVAKPGAWIAVTTPNQLSLLSLACLLVKGRFAMFQDVHYPAHITALIETDLRRIAAECGLTDIEVVYSGEGRVVLTPWHYPRFLSRLFPKRLSDGVLLLARRPKSG